MVTPGSTRTVTPGSMTIVPSTRCGLPAAVQVCGVVMWPGGMSVPASVGAGGDDAPAVCSRLVDNSKMVERTSAGRTPVPPTVPLRWRSEITLSGTSSAVLRLNGGAGLKCTRGFARMMGRSGASRILLVVALVLLGVVGRVAPHGGGGADLLQG